MRGASLLCRSPWSACTTRSPPLSTALQRKVEAYEAEKAKAESATKV